MLKVQGVLFMLHVVHVLCLRGNTGSRGQHSIAFVKPSTVDSTAKNAQNRKFERSAEAVSSSNEPLPYSSGYTPNIAPGDLKFMGQPIEGTFQPQNNFVLILKNEMHNYSEGGIYIGSKPNKEFAGRILAVGPGKYAGLTGALIPMSVKVGDIVLYEPPEEKSVVTYKNKECVLVPEDQIYARVEGDLSSPGPLQADNIKPLSDR